VPDSRQFKVAFEPIHHVVILGEFARESDLLVRARSVLRAAAALPRKNRWRFAMRRA